MNTIRSARSGLIAALAIHLGLTLCAPPAFGAGGTDESGGLPCAFSGYLGSFPATFTGQSYHQIEVDGLTGAALLYQVSDFGVETSGLVTLDVSDPENPVITGGVVIIEYPELLLYRDGLAYVVVDTDPASIQIYDIADPSAPVMIGHTPLTGSARSMSLGDGRLFLRDGPRILVVDVSDPLTPQEVAVFEPPIGLDDFEAAGSLLYVMGDEADLGVYDMTDPDAPELIGSHVSDCMRHTSSNAQISIDGDRLAILALLDVELIDISDPASPAPLACIGIHDVLGSFGPASYGRENPRLRGDRLFFTNYSNGLYEIDLSDLGDPRLVGQQDTPGYVQDYALAGDTCLLADTGSRIAIVDTAALNTVQPILRTWFDGRYDIEAYDDVPVENGIVYLFGYDGYSNQQVLLIIDASGPDEPELLSVYTNDWDHAGDLKIIDGIAFIATGDTGLEVVDCRNPRVPEFMYRAQLLESVESLEFGDGQLAMGGNSAFIVLGVSDPEQPTLDAVVASDHFRGRAFAIHDRTLYLGGREDGQALLETIDVSDPFRPVRDEYPLQAEYERLIVEDGVLYAITERDLGGMALHMSSVDNLGSSTVHVLDEFYPEAMAASDGVLYLGGEGLLMLDAPDPNRDPELIASKGGEYYNLAVEGTELYTYPGELHVIDVGPRCGPCVADFNADTLVNFFDIADYLDAFIAGNTNADLDANGTLNFIDIATFIVAFNAGCP